MTDVSPERWASRRGFVLASLGSAIGLGNVWRFAYVAGENGGGAFLLVYLVMVGVVGLPLLLGEFALGRSTQRECAAAVRAVVAPRSAWRHVGLLGVIVSALVLAYYAVVAGWVLRYLALYGSGRSASLAGPGAKQAFEAHLADPFMPIVWQAVVLGLTVFVILQGVKRGIERLNLVLMPLLGLLLLGLALHAVTLPGWGQGLRFLFDPDWSVLAHPQVYLAALGQAFFSIGLAMGVMVTYGSYLAPEQPLLRSAATVVAGDTLFALLAGLIIFPAVFSFGLDPAQGPGLAFVVLPQVFAQMPAGAWVGVVFFLLLSIAALTSAVSLLEVPVAWALKRFGLSRRTATLGLAALLFAGGVPASLGYSVWRDWVTPGGRHVLDLMDLLAVDVLLPLNGLLLSLLFGWVWPRDQALAAIGLSRHTGGHIWRATLRYLLPVLMGTVLMTSLWRL